MAGAQVRSFAVGDLNGDQFEDVVVASNLDKQSLARFNRLALTGNLRSQQSYAYDAAFSEMTSYTDETGRTTLYTIDPFNGNRLEERKVFGTIGGNDDLVISYTYNSLGLLTSMVDAEGRRTEYEYDVSCQLIAVHFAVGTPSAASKYFSYDDAGNLLTAIDELGRITSYEYDTWNRLTKVTEPDPDNIGPSISPVSRMEYDPSGNLVQIQDPRGFIHRTNFDLRNQVVEEIDPLGNFLRYFYDASGNVIRQVDARGSITAFEYDDRNRVIAMRHSDASEYQFEYDRDDNLVATMDPLGRIDRTFYDARGRVTARSMLLGTRNNGSITLPMT